MNESEPQKMDYIFIDSFDEDTGVAENLKRLLFSLDKELPVIPVCIVGAKSSGKSFLLNYIMRYLEATERKSSVSFGTPEEPLRGYPWNRNSDTKTPSIKIWNKLFSVEINSSNVAILLMDTEGLLDGSKVTSTAAHQIFLDFCLSVSKLMIYNTSGSVSSEELENLKTAATFHQFSYPGHAFIGKLTILVRDWKGPKQFSYGQKGGREYLKHIFELPEEPSASRDMLKKIKDFFGNLNGFLLPSPGGYVAGYENEKGKSFDGAMKDLPSIYLGLLKHFVEEMFSTNIQHIICDSGRKCSLEDFFAVFEYSSRIHSNSFLEGYIERYENQMEKELIAGICPEEHLTALHEHHQSDLIESLVLSIDGDPTLTAICTAELKDKLSQRLDKFKYRNKEKRQTKGRNDVIAATISEYTAAMKELTANRAYIGQEELKSGHDSALQGARSVLIKEGYQDCVPMMEELIKSCEEEFKHYEKRNSQIRMISNVAKTLMGIGLAVFIWNQGSFAFIGATKVWDIVKKFLC